MPIHIPKIAASITVSDCGAPKCESLHLLLLDAKGVGIAQCTVSLQAVKKMNELFYAKAAMKD